MAHTPLILAQFDGDATYANGGAGGTGTETGAVRYRDGHTGGVQAALVEEGTTNWIRDPSYNDNAPATWNFTGSATQAPSTEQASDGTQSSKIVASSAGGGLALPAPAGNNSPAAAQGQAWTLSGDLYGDGAGGVELVLVERSSAGTNLGEWESAEVVPPADWTRYDHSATLAQATTAKVSAYVRTTTGALTFYADRFQLEQKDHATTYCPEWDVFDTTLKSGYTRFNDAGDAQYFTYSRAAAKVEIPTVLPDWVACRYSEDLGETWDFAYITSLTGANVGTYGRISHDGSDLVIQSDRALLIGPLYAGTGSLDSVERDVLASEPVWTFGMDLSGSDAPVVNAGPDAAVAQFALWTQAGSFTDADSSSWTATVDYDDGGGAVPLTLTGTTFTLSHTYTSVGTYTVTVTVDDGEGGVGSDTVQVTVTEAPTLGAFVVLSVAGTDSSAPVIVLP